MFILETPIFTKLVQETLSEEEYRLLQIHLCTSPLAGDLIKGSGGLRKIRWRLKGKGKRGGIRIIYYAFDLSGKILMLYLYKKNECSDLTQAQIKILQKVVEEELYEKRSVR